MGKLPASEPESRLADLATTHDETPIDGDREVRIALVLYGGVSLAIYIHGVTQELLRAVRATAPAVPGAPDQTPLVSELTRTEATYRELGRRAGSAAPFLPDLDPVAHRRVHTRFVIDVVSGTSAGGINGVFLAKALANHQDLAGLRTLWIQEGDVERLLNDRDSTKDLPSSIRLERPPQALLNTRRMAYRLLEALDDVDCSNLHPPADSPLADEIDLYVTATDIRGLVLPIPLWDRAVYERRHRNVFHFLYAASRASGQWRNDFRTTNNGFLAFACRCTSSFPIAFEPMTLGDLERVPPWNRSAGRLIQQAADWRKFYPDYLRSKDGVPAPVPAAVDRFLKRAFGDGGYLDNKPFSYATDGLRFRRNDRRVVRKLVYVEPSPENPELETDLLDRPDPLQNLAAAAFLLPRRETIRQDIERVLERNHVVEKIEEAVRRIDQDLHDGVHLPLLEVHEYVESGLSQMVARYGPSYATYHRIKVSELTNEISEVLMRLAGLDESSGLRVALRHMVHAWRESRYAPNLDKNSPVRRTENQFLVEFDLGYRLRRLEFLQGRLDVLLAIMGREERRVGDDAQERRRVEAGEGGAGPAVRDARRGRLTQRQQVREKGRSEDLGRLAAIVVVPFEATEWLAEANRETIRSEVLFLKQELGAIQVDLRRDGRRIRSRWESAAGEVADGHPGLRAVAAAIDALRVSIEELRWILATPLEDLQRERAEEVLAQPRGRREAVAAVFETLAAELDDIFKRHRKQRTDFFEAMSNRPSRGSDGVGTLDRVTIERALRASLKIHAERFETYDNAVYPLAYGTGIGEWAAVDVIRVSPEETVLLREFHPRDGTRLFHKLAGTRLGNFGSFLAEPWRRSDLLWGRLDGAERIVRATLVPKTDHDEGFVQQFILRAQAAIVCEELAGLSAPECRRVLCQCLVRTVSGKPAPDLLDRMMAKLLPGIREIDPAMAATLAPAELRAFYLEHFLDERHLAPERTLTIFSRASRILGGVLDGLSDHYGPLSRKVGWWLIWMGRVIWGLVEISLPRRIGALLAHYWLNLLYLVSLILTLGGMLFAWEQVRKLGIRALLAFLALDLTRRLTRSLLVRQLRVRTVLVPVVALIAVAGLWTLIRPIPGVEPWIDRQLTTVMGSLRDWLAPLWRFGQWLCPNC